MSINPRSFIESAELGDVQEELQQAGLEGPQEGGIDVDKLPAGVVSGSTLIDFSNTPNVAIRSSVSLAMLFANRVATASMKDGDDSDDWLAAYTSNLGQLGFSLAGSAIVNSVFKKKDVSLHKAIIPFLTVAFGGAAVGPIILAGLKNLQDMDKDAPWIRLFDQESRRFDAHEMHFAAVSSDDSSTSIRYAIARLHVATNETTILFLKITNANAQFQSVTTTMSANNALLATVEPDLKARLGGLMTNFIKEAKLPGA